MKNLKTQSTHRCHSLMKRHMYGCVWVGVGGGGGVVLLIPGSLMTFILVLLVINNHTFPLSVICLMMLIVI